MLPRSALTSAKPTRRSTALRPLFVFDNHDNVRSIDRYAPPGATMPQKLAIARILATILYTVEWRRHDLGGR